MLKTCNASVTKPISIRELVSNPSYVIRYDKAEWDWSKSDTEQLMIKLIKSFSTGYNQKKTQVDLGTYNSYFLATLSVTGTSTRTAIVSGQKELITIILVLMYLIDLHQNSDESMKTLPGLYFFDKAIQGLKVQQTLHNLDEILNVAEYSVLEKGSVLQGIIDQYNFIDELFPETIKKDTLPYFMYWILDNVVVGQEVVEISE
jgi:hypothetical protein